MGKNLALSPDLPAILEMDFAGTVGKIGDDVNNLIAHKPKNISMKAAAALPLVGITAYEGLTRANIKKGQKVLVHGGSGGAGHIALQLAKYFGAEVYSTGGGERQIDLIEKLGAKGINYKTEKVEEYVDQHTGGIGFDLVYDSVGGANLINSFKAAA